MLHHSFGSVHISSKICISVLCRPQNDPNAIHFLGFSGRSAGSFWFRSHFNALALLGSATAEKCLGFVSFDGVQQHRQHSCIQQWNHVRPSCLRGMEPTGNERITMPFKHSCINVYASGMASERVKLESTDRGTASNHKYTGWYVRLRAVLQYIAAAAAA